MTVEEASRVMGFLQTGLSQRQVGAQFNVSHTVIGRLWTRYQQTNSVQRRPQSGRSKRTTAHQDRQTALLAKRNRMSSAVTLNREFRAASGVRISTQMVRNRLHASGLHARKPAVRPLLTARHVIAVFSLPGVMPTGVYVVFDLYFSQMNLGSV